MEHIKTTLSKETAHNILSGNAAKWYGFDLDYLAENRDEVTRHQH